MRAQGARAAPKEWKFPGAGLSPRAGRATSTAVAGDAAQPLPRAGVTPRERAASLGPGEEGRAALLCLSTCCALRDAWLSAALLLIACFSLRDNVRNRASSHQSGVFASPHTSSALLTRRRFGGAACGLPRVKRAPCPVAAISQGCDCPQTSQHCRQA